MNAHQSAQLRKKADRLKGLGYAKPQQKAANRTAEYYRSLSRAGKKEAREEKKETPEGPTASHTAISLAEEHGVSWQELHPGSGKDGKVTIRDVRDHIASLEEEEEEEEEE